MLAGFFSNSFPMPNTQTHTHTLVAAATAAVVSRSQLGKAQQRCAKLAGEPLVARNSPRLGQQNRNRNRKRACATSQAKPSQACAGWLTR